MLFLKPVHRFRGKVKKLKEKKKKVKHDQGFQTVSLILIDDVTYNCIINYIVEN